MAPTLPHSAQVRLLRALLGAVRRLGWRRASALGAGVGAFAYRVLRVRRDVVEGQLAMAFPEMSAAERKRVARGAYESLGRTSFEAAAMPLLTSEQTRALMDIDNIEVLTDAVARGKGVILITGHLGNWELGGAIFSSLGVPTDAIVRPMANKAFDLVLRESRARPGYRLIDEKEAVRQVPRTLRERGAVGMLIDQGALGPASTYVPFFGRMARTPRGPAVFALRLGVPLVFGSALRQPDGRFRVRFEEVPVADTGDKERDVDTIVAAYTQTLERHVRLAPEQYFWHHRRWKWRPPRKKGGNPRADNRPGARPSQPQRVVAAEGEGA